MLGLSRTVAKATWTASLVVLALYGVWLIRKTLLVLALAVFFSYMVFPLVHVVHRLGRGRVSRPLAIGVVFFGLFLIVSIGVALIGPAVGEQASNLTQQLPTFLEPEHLAQRLPLPDFLEPYRARIAAFIRAHLEDGSRLATPVLQQAGGFLLGFASNLIFAIVIPILSFLLIREGPHLRDRFLGWASGRRHGSMWQAIVGDMDLLLGRYMRALVLLSIAATATYAIVFTVAGLPFGLLLACVSGLFEFVPVFGPLAAAVLTLCVGGLSGYEHLLAMAAFIAGYRVFQDYVLNPYLMSGGVEISPLLVILGLLAGEELGGVAGIFLSVPVLAGARVFVMRLLLERAGQAGEGGKQQDP